MVRLLAEDTGGGGEGRAVAQCCSAPRPTGLVLVIVVGDQVHAGRLARHRSRSPLLVLMFLGIHRHYRRTARRLPRGAAADHRFGAPRSVTSSPSMRSTPPQRAQSGTRERSAGPTSVPCMSPGVGPEHAIHPRWLHSIGARPRLEVLSPGAGRVGPLLEYVWTIPPVEAASSMSSFPSTSRGRRCSRCCDEPPPFLLELRLLKEPGVVVTDVPVVGEQRVACERLVGRVLVFGVHGASLGPVSSYARTLPLDDIRAVFFAFDAEEAAAMRSGLAGVRGSTSSSRSSRRRAATSASR